MGFEPCVCAPPRTVLEIFPKWSVELKQNNGVCFVVYISQTQDPTHKTFRCPQQKIYLPNLLFAVSPPRVRRRAHFVGSLFLGTSASRVRSCRGHGGVFTETMHPRALILWVCAMLTSRVVVQAGAEIPGEVGAEESSAARGRVGARKG